MAISVVMFFWPKYRRLAAERKLTAVYQAGLARKKRSEDDGIQPPPAYAAIVAAQPGPVLLRPAGLSSSDSFGGDSVAF